MICKDLGDGEDDIGDDDGDNKDGEGDVYGYAKLFLTFITFHLSFIMILLVLFQFFYLC